MALSDDLYRKEVVRTDAAAPVSEVAELMLRKSVGCVVLMTDDDRPVGVITDRDLMARVVASGRQASTPASAVMSKPLVTVEATAPLSSVVARMQEHGIRRIGVVEAGELVGLVSLDDLLFMLGQELYQIGDAARTEIKRSQRTERLLELREELNALVDQGIEQAGALSEKASAALSTHVESFREAIRKRFS